MPENIVDIPLLNSIRFVPVSPDILNFDSLLFRNQIRYYEQQVESPQKWVFGDPLALQVTSNFAPVNMDLIRCDGISVASYNFDVIDTNLFNPGFEVYEYKSVIPVVEEGLYYYLLKVGSDATLETFISEPQYFAPSLPQTVFYKYRNTFDAFDVVFQTGITFGFRCDGSRGKLTPQSKTTVWQDQPLNLKIIKSIPYRTFKMNVGGKYGVPDWVIDKVNRIHCCNVTFMDDTQYTLEEGAKWEPIEAEFYPLKGWRIDIRETKNRFSLRAQNNFSPAEQFAVVYNIETKAFGTFNGSASNNIIQITKVE